MTEVWLIEVYALHKLDLEKQRATFHRIVDGVSHVDVPKWLTAGRVPDAARAELEDFFAYIKKKYGISPSK